MPQPDLSSPQIRPLVDAMMAVAGTQGWAAVTPATVAAQAGVSLATLWRYLPTEQPALAGLVWLAVRLTDAAVLAGPAANPAEPAFDRVFEVVMRRIDALAGWKPGIAALHQAAKADPLLGVSLAWALRVSMGWMLTAAGLDNRGWRCAARQVALADVWRRTVMAWLADDGDDLGHTMAALDQALRRHAGVLGIVAPSAA